MNRRFQKPIFFILVVRPPQQDRDIQPLEEESIEEGNPETASEENFSEEESVFEAG